MKNKLLKGIKYLCITLLLCLLYGFTVKKYDNYSGKEYVQYWEENKNLFESVKQNENLTFRNLDEYIKTNNLFLYGEFHGIKETTKIDFELIKYLNKKAGMKIHLAEIDFSQAYFLNEYLKNGDEKLIDYVLKSWIIYHGHNNFDYKNKWIQIRKLNGINSEDSQIRVYGIDKVQNINVTKNHLKILLGRINLSIDFPKEENLFLEWTKDKLPKLISTINLKSTNINYVTDIEHIRKNLVDYKTTTRENIMFLNFNDLYKRYDFKGQKIYGYFGEAHVLQKEMNNKKDFGALVKNPNSPVKDKTYTIISRYLDSYMDAPSKYLPFFLRSNKKHTKTGVSCDNTFSLYHFGISDLKNITNKKTNTFFDINKSTSPYKNSLRLIKSTGLLSLISGMKITDKKTSTTDYAQGIILIRNSDWAEPLK
ncbi:erythromycin esterase family protein [Flavobacterium sp. H122]|uniref:erythromycin esterase family protein n=1 Tax=Flavobacterium sp. H122 TaxID=2529860 RepID=UPI0010AAABC8|nr:erythromycin esterase family protein [Flavobacterium sp. H122]